MFSSGKVSSSLKKHMFRSGITFISLFRQLQNGTNSLSLEVAKSFSYSRFKQLAKIIQLLFL